MDLWAFSKLFSGLTTAHRLKSMRKESSPGVKRRRRTRVARDLNKENKIWLLRILKADFLHPRHPNSLAATPKHCSIHHCQSRDKTSDGLPEPRVENMLARSERRLGKQKENK